MWFPSLHPLSAGPNTANKIRLFVKQLKISTFPVKAFWPSFAYHSGVLGGRNRLQLSSYYILPNGGIAKRRPNPQVNPGQQGMPNVGRLG